ncbi:MAG: LuxR C-terminal-related transcriptional regulator, partial [Planctomycetota bacterium]
NNPAGVSGFVWDALTAEPHTGVSLMTADGRITYVNAQATAIYFGPDADPKRIAGRMIDELYPPAFCEDRRRVLKQVASTNKPMLFRTIWRGFQHHAWLYPTPTEPESSESSPHPLPGVLVITRRSFDDPGDIPANPADYTYECAEVNDLGELDVLTPRELEVLALLGQGLSVPEVAGLLHRSGKTIETHRDRIAQKLRKRSRGELVMLVQRAGLTPADAQRKHV